MLVYQYKIVVNGDEFLINLLLYRRKLRSIVAIELKIGRVVEEALKSATVTMGGNLQNQ